MAGPIITNQSPAPGALASRYTPISFDVTDADGLHFVAVSFRYVGDRDWALVHDFDAFRGDFVESPNAVAAITDGKRYTLLPLGGWRGSFEVEAIGCDALGEVMTGGRIVIPGGGV